MRRYALAAVGVALLVATPGAVGAIGRPILGLTGDIVRFHDQTDQDTVVRQAFLGWGQGQSYGAPFQVLFDSLQPVPMIHLGTKAKGNKKTAITPAGIAAGLGDGYLSALNAAISQWGKPIYIRPLAEMNGSGNSYSGFLKSGASRGPQYTPKRYRHAFARIFILVHGGTAAQLNAKLSAVGLPGWRGGDLAVNAFPRVRVLWSPLAGGTPQIPANDAVNYWPGDAYVDVGGGDIYKEGGVEPPWTKFEALFTFVKAHKKPWAVPEWGLFGVDDKDFVPHMCRFFKTHDTELEAFYESRLASIFDLAPKPISRNAYKTCVTPYGVTALPSWARGGPGTAKQLALRLTPNPGEGDAPLDVSFDIVAKLSVPIVKWQLLFGDGTKATGDGDPPTSADHTYRKDGRYQETLIVYQAPPFVPTAARFFTAATVTVGAGADALRVKATPLGGKAPLKVSFQIDTTLTVSSWQLIFGDGLSNGGAGKPPHFAGHTFTKAGVYNVLLIVNGSIIVVTDIHVA